jgi:phospholipase C
MTRFRVCLMFVLLSTVGLLLSLNGCGGNAPARPPHQPVSLIQHVVVIFQENRTPDNLFQDPVLIAHGADIASTGINSKG